MIRRPPGSNRTTHSFPTRRSSDLPEILRNLAGHRVSADLHRLAEEEVGSQHLRVVLPGRRRVEAGADSSADSKGVAKVILPVELEHGDRKSTRLNSSH